MMEEVFKDIETREDITLLIDAFYKQVIADEIIGHFFTNVIELDWGKHIPVMYDFWESTLLGGRKYAGNPMVKHIELNDKETIMPDHFNRWLRLWEETVRGNFNGKKAEEAIQRARDIGGLMQYKIQQHSSGN